MCWSTPPAPAELDLTSDPICRRAAMAVTTPGETADETSAARHTRRARARTAAAAHGVPLATIIVSAAVVSATYLAGKLIYRLHRRPGSCGRPPHEGRG